ncbi:Protein of unknown function [Formosa sp. Hel1_31_208]|uniref:Pvc16 family protein n=1 Tax=Formosa sp. Hel1_31_208 TaxID=1798225 RepID=UPI00087C8BD7|nr:Pvc16 family protein [Formosa sp. Hel1_31_208]SDS16362.1 Protein of unknown function [Formosa sp. Hel1_31_208]
MIETTLGYLTLRLNEDIKRQLKTTDDILSLARVSDASVRTPLLLSVIQVNEDTSISNAALTRTISQNVERIAAPQVLKLHVLISVNTQINYKEGLRYLSQAMNSINAHPVMTLQNTVNLPQDISKIYIETMTFDLDQQALLWQSLKVAYQPSIVYKLRVIGRE